jgi:hypothetical protein
MKLEVMSMMSETKMHGFAFYLTMALSPIAAGVYYLMGASPFAVAVGVTVVGVLIYVTTCMFCSPLVLAPVPVPIDEDEDYV